MDALKYGMTNSINKKIQWGKNSLPKNDTGTIGWQHKEERSWPLFHVIYKIWLQMDP